jgi:hypothetical protein
LSSEITTARVPTVLPGGEGNIRRSAKRELRGNPAESENLACVEASWAIVANREIRESPGIQELEWENPADKNLLVYREALEPSTSKE